RRRPRFVGRTDTTTACSISSKSQSSTTTPSTPNNRRHNLLTDAMPPHACFSVLANRILPEDGHGISSAHLFHPRVGQESHFFPARTEVPLLEVKDLDVRFSTPDGDVHAVKRLSFDLDRGETLGIVGESGSGKSQSMLALLGLLAENGRATGSAVLHGRDLLALPERELRRIRGRTISMIFQDPMTSLNPYRKVGEQMSDVLRAHERVSAAAARARCTELLDAVRIPDAAQRLERYPHEMSGGMRQRVMIAASLLLNPEILVADEPTTALDVTVQAQILELLKDLKDRFGTAIVLITHDLGVVAGLAEDRKSTPLNSSHVKISYAVFCL